MLTALLFIGLIGSLNAEDPNCSDGTHGDNEFFAPDGECLSYCYYCLQGQLNTLDCNQGLSCDNALKLCNWPSAIPACSNPSPGSVVDCKDKDGNAVNIPSYTKPKDCSDGTYYKCENGVEVPYKCPDGLVYDPNIGNCNWANAVECPVATTLLPGYGVTSTIASNHESTSTRTIKPTPPLLPMKTTTAKKPPITSTVTSVYKSTTPIPDYCAEGLYTDGDMFVPDDGCVPYYYLCDNGEMKKQDCPPGTVFDSKASTCQHPDQVEACKELPLSCTDENGKPIDRPNFAKSDDCENGIYYKCVDGSEVEVTCPPGYIFDPTLGSPGCNVAENVDECFTNVIPPTTTTLSSEATKIVTVSVETTSMNHEKLSTTVLTTTTEKQMEETTSRSSPKHTTSPSSNIDISSPPKKTTTTSSPPSTKQPTTEESPGAEVVTTTTESTAYTEANPSETISTDLPAKSTTAPTTTTRQTTTAFKPSPTYLGFVVDDTGSMSNEIVAVKEWITNCIDGNYADCADPPSGGWVVTSFNDPYTGVVTGPTTDVNGAIDAVNDLYAHGGGDCPEMSFTGIQNAVDVIPRDNGGCKVFFFTDATAKDAEKATKLNETMLEKGCSLILMLTGCCGTCEDVCDFTDEEWCKDHTVDDATSRRRRSSTSSTAPEALYYSISEATGGNIYITDKPSNPDELLDFMEEEVTMGFCPTNEIAGPSPDGYKCEADCVGKSMCWDRSVSTCYCNGSIPCAYDPVTYTQCGGPQVVTCDPNMAFGSLPDTKNCEWYYLCNIGTPYHFQCANGTVYSEDSPSFCDHPSNVPPPCGTLSSSTETLH